MSAPIGTILIVGNPNGGKTSLFNRLTGANQRVGNYSGVTVERSTGECEFADGTLELADLPGIYSLGSRSPEERVARHELLARKPGEVVLQVADASALDRHLHLTQQLLEMRLPLVLALNMIDLADQRGLEIDAARLSEQLGGIRIVKVSALTGQGLEELVSVLGEAIREPACGRLPRQTSAIEAALDRLEANWGQTLDAASLAAIAGPSPDPRWLLLKLLEEDTELAAAVETVSPALVEAVRQEITAFEADRRMRPALAVSMDRYARADAILAAAVHRPETSGDPLTDRLDKVLLHPAWGPAILCLLMFLLFTLTFSLGGIFSGWMELGFIALAQAVSSHWPTAGLLAPFKDLVCEGVIGGVGGVLIFLPNIVILFAGIVLLEDSGYMVRVAFLTERVMGKIGLHGKSFIPLLTGFGCSVPAIMATRTLENRADRLATIMVIPLMSCGARLPIYALLIPAFFAPAWRPWMLVAIYSIGILLAIPVAWWLRKKVLRQPPTPLLMELPAYHRPTLRTVSLHVWGQASAYLKKAGTVLLAASVVLWALQTYPRRTEFTRDYAAELSRIEQQGADRLQTVANNSERQAIQEETEETAAHLRTLRQKERAEYTVAGRAGKVLLPFLQPLGFDERIGTALIGAFAAKEVMVAQLGVSFSMDADNHGRQLQQILRQTYSPLQGFCIMLFALISIPCIATFTVTRKETGSWGWAFAQLGLLTAVAYVVTFAVYQLGRMLGG